MEMNELRTAWPAGLKKTRQRQCVLSVLERASSPLSAMEICKRTEGENCPVWLSTVYRILELFVKEHVAVKTTIPNSETAYYELNRNQHRHYAVCLGCHKVVEIDNCPMEKFIPRLSEDDFHVLGHKVEMYGYCRNCEGKK